MLAFANGLWVVVWKCSTPGFPSGLCTVAGCFPFYFSTPSCTPFTKIDLSRPMPTGTPEAICPNILNNLEGAQFKCTKCSSGIDILWISSKLIDFAITGLLK